MEQGEDVSRQPVGANRGWFDMCWSRGTYEFVEVWRDGDATQYSLGSLNCNLPVVGKAATPETSPMSLGFRPAEHEGEQGVKHWRDGGSEGSPLTNSEGEGRRMVGIFRHQTLFTPLSY